MARVSIASVAERAGVSLSTVSRVLNEPSKVQPDTKRRVFEAMRELGYTSGGRRERDCPGVGTVALAVPNLELDSVIQFFRELQKALVPHEKHVVVLDLEGERDFFLYEREHRLRFEYLDAVVAFSLRLDRQAADLLERHDMPAVVVQSRNPFLHSINNNNFAGAFDAVSYLFDRGYARPAFAGWTYEDETLKDRRAGYRAALERSGAGTAAAVEASGELSFSGGVAAMRELLDRDERPDSAFFACDVMALGALEACRERGVAVPEDLGIIGFDDIPQSAWWGLSTMDQHLREKAEATVAYLAERWAGRTPYERPMEITISSQVVARSTTK